MEKITTVEQFDKLIQGVALVDFYADWCGPCKMLGPIIEEVAGEYQGRANVIKVNVDDLRVLAEKYRVSSIPAVFLFVDGEVRESVVGFKPKKVWTDLIDKYL